MKVTAASVRGAVATPARACSASGGAAGSSETRAARAASFSRSASMRA